MTKTYVLACDCLWATSVSFKESIWCIDLPIIVDEPRKSFVTVCLSEEVDLSSDFQLLDWFVPLFPISNFLYDCYFSIDLTRWLVFRCMEISFALNSATKHQSIGSPADHYLVKDIDIDVIIMNTLRDLPDNVQFHFFGVRRHHAFCFWMEQPSEYQK